MKTNKCPECHQDLIVESDETTYKVRCSSCTWVRTGKRKKLKSPSEETHSASELIYKIKTVTDQIEVKEWLLEKHLKTIRMYNEDIDAATREVNNIIYNNSGVKLLNKTKKHLFYHNTTKSFIKITKVECNLNPHLINYKDPKKTAPLAFIIHTCTYSSPSKSTGVKRNIQRYKIGRAHV